MTSVVDEGSVHLAPKYFSILDSLDKSSGFSWLPHLKISAAAAPPKNRYANVRREAGPNFCAGVGSAQKIHSPRLSDLLLFVISVFSFSRAHYSVH